MKIKQSRRSTPIDVSLLSVTVRDLIQVGLIQAPTSVVGRFGTLEIKATLEADGGFRRGEYYSSSPSVAAGRAITMRTGRTSPGRSYFSVNGWKFWQVMCSDGAVRSLAAVRTMTKERSKA